MDKNEFFRNATLRICGNLAIEKALFACLKYLKEVMPVDIMVLEYYDHEYGAMRTIARAAKSNYVKLDLITPLSDEAKKSAALEHYPNDIDVFIFSPARFWI